jgi:hypothetical protein
MVPLTRPVESQVGYKNKFALVIGAENIGQAQIFDRVFKTFSMRMLERLQGERMKFRRCLQMTMGDFFLGHGSTGLSTKLTVEKIKCEQCEMCTGRH